LQPVRLPARAEWLAAVNSCRGGCCRPRPRRCLALPHRLALTLQVQLGSPCCLQCGKILRPQEAAEAKEQRDVERCAECSSRHKAGHHCQLCQRVWFDWEQESGLLASCTRCGCKVHGSCDDRALLHLKVGQGWCRWCRGGGRSRLIERTVTRIWSKSYMHSNTVGFVGR